MFPFMAAAAIHEQNIVNATTTRDLRSMQLRKLNLCFKVLRADPTVVSEGIEQSDHEVYFRNKWKQEEARRLTDESELAKAQSDLAKARKMIEALRQENHAMKQTLSPSIGSDSSDYQEEGKAEENEW